jgi:hypothetical protein
MAKMNTTQKKAFLARMAKGRRSAGAAAGMGAKSAAGSTAGYYEIVDRLGRNDLVGRGNEFSSRKSAAKALASLRRDKSEDYTNFKIRHVRSAGRVAGGMVKRRKPAPKRKAGAAIKRLPAVLPKRKGHARGRVGGGTPAVRLARIETAVTDLARANHAIVSKVVEHEKRLNHVESTLSNWAKGRR